MRGPFVALKSDVIEAWQRRGLTPCRRALPANAEAQLEGHYVPGFPESKTGLSL